MLRDDIRLEVLNVLADFVDEPGDADTSEDLGLDSFSRLCVLAELEGHFDVVLGDDDIQDVESVDQLVDVFSAALAQGEPPQLAPQGSLEAAMGGG